IRQARSANQERLAGPCGFYSLNLFSVAADILPSAVAFANVGPGVMRSNAKIRTEGTPTDAQQRYNLDHASRRQGPAEPPLARLAHLGHRPLQLPLPVLHAGRRLRRRPRVHAAHALAHA